MGNLVSFKSVFFTLLLSMAPVSELRGAIPYGLAHDIPLWLLLPMCVIANLLPVPFVIVFIRRILAWMARRGGTLGTVAGWLERHAHKKLEVYRKYELLGLFILVAIPLPGTGAWSGALIAAVMNMRLRNALPSILLGVLIAGILVSGITYGFTSIFN